MYVMTLQDQVEFWWEMYEACREIIQDAGPDDMDTLFMNEARALELWSIYGQMPDECYKPGRMNEDLFESRPWCIKEVHLKGEQPYIVAEIKNQEAAIEDYLFLRGFTVGDNWCCSDADQEISPGVWKLYVYKHNC